MNISNNYTLKTMADSAATQISNAESRFGGIESSLSSRMNNKSTKRLIGSFIATLVWLAAFLAAAIVLKSYVPSRILLIAIATLSSLLCIFMLLDCVINVSYYGKISGFRKAVSSVKNKLSRHREQIQTKQGEFMSAKSKGFELPLSASTSVFEQYESISAKTRNMESLKNGFMYKAKNFFYFAVAIGITLFGCAGLFGINGEIMMNISNKYIEPNTLNILNIIALAIALIVEIFVAKYIWGKTHCNVNNATVFGTLVGPVAYLVLTALLSLVYRFLAGVIAVVIGLLGNLIVLGLISSSCSGG